MKGKKGTAPNNLEPALEAIANLAVQEFERIFDIGHMAALSAHFEIEAAPVKQKTGLFYRNLLPWRRDLVSLLAGTYRRYFKLALAHSHLTGRDPHTWALGQLQPAVSLTLQSICDWYILACDGENEYVRHEGTVAVVPGQTVSLPIATTAAPFPPLKAWRAPAWLFQISLALVGVGPLKDKHVPPTDTEEKLGAAHTRLLLKGARRVFLWELSAAIATVRNEEIAAAGAIRTDTISAQRRGPNKRKGWEQREKLYHVIREILARDPSLQGMAFCAALDKRHAKPLFDWKKCGQWREGLTWKEAWSDRDLRRKIRRVRQEAQKLL